MHGCKKSASHSSEALLLSHAPLSLSLSESHSFPYPSLCLCSDCYSHLQVSRILYSFSTAFKRSSRPAPDVRDQALALSPDSDLYTFTVSLEVKEDDGKGNYRSAAHTHTHIPTRAHTHTQTLTQSLENKALILASQKCLSLT